MHNLSHQLFAGDTARNDLLADYLSASWAGASAPDYRAKNCADHVLKVTPLDTLAPNDPAHHVKSRTSQKFILDTGLLLRHGSVRPDSLVAVARHKRTREGHHLHPKILRPD
jgi:hypothetical protein